jgi:hypothetical protein
MAYIKQIIFLLSLTVVSLTLGCSTFTQSPDPAARATRVALLDQRLSTEFADEGIKIHYTILGKIEKIEVRGTAALSRRDYDVLAEADAKVKLTKFLHSEKVISDSRIKVISHVIERAQDRGTAELGNRDLDPSGAKLNQPIQLQANQVYESLVTTLTIVTSTGKLRGVRKVRDYIVDSGHTYVAVYEWNEEHQGFADQVRETMFRNR